MYSPPSGSTATTRPCRCWPRARRSPAGCGPMCATTGRSAGQTAPPAVLFHYSRDRRGQHPEAHLAGYAGILQADAYAGFTGLYDATRAGGADRSKPRVGPMPGASSSSSPTSPAPARRRRHRSPSRRSAGSTRSSPSNATINGLRGRRAACRSATSTQLPWSVDLETWMKRERAKLSRHADVAKAMDYMLKRWAALHPVPRRRPDLSDDGWC